MTHHGTHPPQTLGRWLWRYATGAHLDGQVRTDAGWLAPGTRALTVTGRATRWAHRPRAHRAALRLAVTAALAGTLAGYLAAPTATLAALAGTLAAGTGLAGWRTWRAVRAWQHGRRYVRPLARALAGPLGYPATPAGWLDVPPTWRAPDYSRPDHGVIRITLPATLDDGPEVRRTVGRILAGRLGVAPDDLDVTWHMTGPRPYVSARLAARPPARVTLADVAAEVRAASDAAPVLGVGARGRIVAVDLDTDAPHLAVSAGTGAGKSVLIRGLIAQWLRHGVQVIYLDGKRTSQSWCRDLAGVTYCHRPADMHRALTEVQAETDRRYEVILAAPADAEADPEVGPRIVVIVEEQNVAAALLAAYWAEVRGKGDPKRSPAFSALDYLLCAGRQARVHVVSVAQYFTVQAAGGNPAARENYGARILARATRNAWQMLAPESGPPYPRPHKHRGRMYLALDGTVTEVQGLIWTVAEARSWATSGASVTVPATWTTGPGQRDSTDVTASDRWVTLAEAARDGVVPISYAALRQRRVRTRQAWPDPREDGRYRVADLAAWWAAESGAAPAEAAGQDSPAGESAA